MIGIRNASPADKESRIQNLESGIHSVESRIQVKTVLMYSPAWGNYKFIQQMLWYL